MKILFIGDIMGKIGRRAVQAVLPKWKQEHDPDLVIANAENIAHGKGFNRKSLEEMQSVGVDFFTSGNHISRNDDGFAMLGEKGTPIIRPANYPDSVVGDGWRVIEVGATKVAIINLLGQVFIHENLASPFHTLDRALKDIGEQVKIRIVDFHAEATSEKIAFGWYADGRASAVFGTHTHVPTADAKILPKKTGYITDVGMCGAVDSVIGTSKESIIRQFLEQIQHKHGIPDSGVAEVNAVVADIDRETGSCKEITHLYAETSV